MDLSLTEDQRLIAEAAAEFLAEACDSRAMRAAADSADGFDRALWQRIVELGWCGVQAAEDDGGLGLGWVEQVLLQEQLGRRLAPVPFFDSVVCAATLLRELERAGAAGTSAGWRRRIESGELVATLADLGAGAGPASGGSPGRGAARVSLAGDGLRLDGQWRQVPAAAESGLLLLSANNESGDPVLLAVPADTPGLQRRPLATVDRTRRCADVQAEAVALPADARLAQGALLAHALERATDLAAIALAGSQVGVAQQCLDLALAYAAQRVQFGQPIAAFQAVKHRCAQMAVAVEGARSAVYGAAALADAQAAPRDAASAAQLAFHDAAAAAQLAFHAAQARCEATEAAQFCAQEAIQLHGGVGFTWEYDPQLYFKRAQADSQRLGPLTWWRERVAALWLDRPESAPGLDGRVAAPGLDEAA